MSENCALNTDRELYREDTGDPAGSYYENSVHVTEGGGIGMNVGGTVIVQPIAAWHAQALRSMLHRHVPMPDTDQWAQRVVASIPRPTPSEEDAAALDYAETALSEAWAVLRRIADDAEDPRKVATDYLNAIGFSLPAARPRPVHSAAPASATGGPARTRR